jgi:Hemerythrin HHE cation binding domain
MHELIELIERDHREVEELFAKLEANDDAATALALCDALDRHAAGEQVAIDPVVAAELPNGRQMAGECEDEHTEVRGLVEQLRRAEGADERARVLAALEAVVEEHVDAEEAEVLPQLRAVFDDDRLSALSREFDDAKRAWSPARGAAARWAGAASRYPPT